MTRSLRHLRWTPAGVTLTQAAALTPPFLAALALRGPAALGVLAAALVAALLWEAAFALIRRRALTAHGLTTALIVAVMVPAAVPLWQVGVAVSLGVVLAELIFGGRGFGFLNAGAASLAFLVFSFPGISLLGGEGWVAAASLAGAALVLAAGLAPWRILAGAAAMVVLLGLPGDVALAPVETGAALVFGLVFLACDPVGGAGTRAGQWLYGALTGGLIVLFGAGTGPAISANAVVFAVLLASIFAPLLDHLAVEANLRWRARRAGRTHG